MNNNFPLNRDFYVDNFSMTLPVSLYKLKFKAIQVGHS